MSERLTSALKKAAVLAVPLFLAFAVWEIAVTPLFALHRDLDVQAGRSLDLVRRYRALASQEDEIKSALLHLKEENSAEDLLYNTPTWTPRRRCCSKNSASLYRQPEDKSGPRALKSSPKPWATSPLRSI